VLRYALTETEGFTRNLQIVDARKPDFVLMPGDLVQGAGYQPAWDEYFRHVAGEFGDLFTRVPFIAAYGNWETFAAASGGYGTAADRSPVVKARQRFKTFIDGPDNGTPAHRSNYHRIDYGPVTIITLDSTKGAPEDAAGNYPTASKLTGRQYTGPGTDTQSSFRADEYALAAQRLGITNDLSPYNEGSVQWRWAEAQLADARAKGRIVFVQFHHAPYSDGEHGLPMNHAQTSGQGGTPMRAYHTLFERYGVVAVLSGHSEMFERSFVDEDGDGVGVHYFDVGVAGDGLRGERRTSNGFTEGASGNRLQYNSFSRWSADEHEAERWSNLGGALQLVDGGKHYGHLEVELERVTGDPAVSARVRFMPVYSFPLLDADYRVVGTARRLYGDGFSLSLDATGRVRR
jgi:3',5'-cyclic AMP phosphodiesterase CpdA